MLSRYFPSADNRVKYGNTVQSASTVPSGLKPRALGPLLSLAASREPSMLTSTDVAGAPGWETRVKRFPCRSQSAVVPSAPPVTSFLPSPEMRRAVTPPGFAAAIDAIGVRSGAASNLTPPSLPPRASVFPSGDSASAAAVVPAAATDGCTPVAPSIGVRPCAVSAQIVPEVDVASP